MLTFTQVDGEAPKITLTGRAALRKLRVENHAVEIPYTASLDNLEVSSTRSLSEWREAIPYWR